MNSASVPTLPGIHKLYSRDLVISKAARLAIFGLLIAGGSYWATRPVPGVPVNENLAFEAEHVKYVIMGGFAMTAISLLVLLWRYLRVKKIITQGMLVKGTMDDLNVRKTETNTGRPLSAGKQYNSTYFATVRYTVLGTERTKRIKMPNSGFVYGLVKGRPVDLFVLDSLPDKPIIRNVYLGSRPIVD